MIEDDELTKISFRMPTQKAAEFAGKLKYDQTNGAKFLRAVVDAYLDDQDEFMKWWFEYKNTLNYPKIRLKGRIKLIKEGKELEKDFALNKDEIENIFDILENIED
jgi:hypothetical protein